MAPATIPEPRAHRGEIPKVRPPRERSAFPWAKHRELAMGLPPTRQIDGSLRGGWVLVGEAKRKGEGPKARRREIWNLRKRLERYINVRYPLERYQLSCVPAEGTLADYELYMRYLGTLTPEEDRLDRIKRRQNYEAQMASRRVAKARRALENRAQGGAQG